MQVQEETIAQIGDEPPLYADALNGPPDRREISARWLSGTFLTGLTSTILMGVALMAALDGRQTLATPPEIAAPGAAAPQVASGESAKTHRLSALQPVLRGRDRRRMEVSTVSRVGDREVVRAVPFVEVKMALAANHATTRDYPPFNPLDVFAETGSVQTATTGLIYGAKVESEVSFKTVDFPLGTSAFDETVDLTADEVEEVVRTTAPILTDGDIQVAALHYVDPQRFGDQLTPETILASYGVRIVPENVSVSQRAMANAPTVAFAEEIVPVQSAQSIARLFKSAGYDGPDSMEMAEALAKLLGEDRLEAGTLLRIGVEVRGETGKVIRASVYNGARHVKTVALNDRSQFVPASEPEIHPEIAAAFDRSTPLIRTRGDLPTAYDGIYKAAYSYGMSRQMTQQLIKLLAADVDFQSRLSPTDRLDVLFSQPDKNDHASPDSELLYVSAHFGGNTRNFYRFQMEDGAVDYFDAEGRSARQFLLRNPVPNGRFRSGFGMRRHPILGYQKRHTGVDWSAPRGTPIIAAGSGIVEHAGWKGGYGRQTIIRHTNGYVSSYAHQSGIAAGVAPGARVRQGQVIGYVGATGLATGDHLHYELMVNGTKVDPMRVRLPTSRVLKGKELADFERERTRIDELLRDEGSGLKVASR